MELAKIIKKHRELNHWSQEELAEKLHVSRQSISKWESGTNYPSLDILVAMSDLFDITLDHLVKGDNEFKQKILDGKLNKHDKRGRTMGDFFAGYWWLIFPLGGFFYGIFAQIVKLFQ
jgi:transcriptional regulator with XRE-family HTH domain